MSTRRKVFAVVWAVAFVAYGVWLEAHGRDVASLISFFVALFVGPALAGTKVEPSTEEREEDPLSRLKW